MPVIEWFDEKPEVEWAEKEHTEDDPVKNGMGYYIYPLDFIVPHVRLTKQDVKELPMNSWITDIEKSCNVGKIDKDGFVSYVIEIGENLEDYLSNLPKGTARKFRRVMRKNADLKVVYDRKEDLDRAWPWYVSKIKELNDADYAHPINRQTLKWRKKLYSSSDARIISFYDGDKLVGVNTSLWKDGVVYDLAMIRRPTKKVNKRVLGYYAIIKNLEWAIKWGMKKYDLLVGEYDYKKEFSTKEEKTRQYIKCSKTFARTYNIPFKDVNELVDLRKYRNGNGNGNGNGMKQLRTAMGTGLNGAGR